MYVVLALSWNIISGFTGYTSFGHVAFYGIGAYACAILVADYGWPWLPTLGVGAVVAAVVGGGDRLPGAAPQGPLLRHRHAGGGGGHARRGHGVGRPDPRRPRHQPAQRRDLDARPTTRCWR